MGDREDEPAARPQHAVHLAHDVAGPREVDVVEQEHRDAEVDGAVLDVGQVAGVARAVLDAELLLGLALLRAADHLLGDVDAADAAGAALLEAAREVAFAAAEVEHVEAVDRLAPLHQERARGEVGQQDGRGALPVVAGVVVELAGRDRHACCSWAPSAVRSRWSQNWQRRRSAVSMP